MNFDQFESLDNTRERKGGYTMIKEQSFDNLKYRKSEKKIKGKDGKADSTIMEGRFYVSKAKVKSLNLATNGFHIFTAKDGSILLGVTSEKDAQVLRSPKQHKDEATGEMVNGIKSTSFTSPKLELALEALKVIDTSKVGDNQFIDMTSVATNVNIKGIAVSEAFTLSIGKAKEKVETPVEKLAVSAPVAAAQPELAAVGKDSSWD